MSGFRVVLSAALAALPLLAAAPASAQATGTLAGRVLDEESLEPVVGMLVRVHDTQVVGHTGADGRFEITGLTAGTTVVRFEHLAYGDHLRAVVVQPDSVVRIALRVPRRPIELDAIVVEARSELEQRRVSSGHSINEIRRPTIDQASQMGMGLGDLLQQGMSGVQVRQGSAGPGSCVEYRGATDHGDGLCRQMAVFLDGVPVSVPAALFPHMPLRDIERLEVLSPGQAGATYGSAAGWGVLLIETRRGTRPDGRRVPGDDHVFGFDWRLEEQSYPWTRVASGALVGNAVGVGLSLLAAEQCFQVHERGILGVRRRCNAITTMATGFLTFALPAVGGAYGARWGGTTERSRGRFLPATIAGTLTAATGYFLFVEG